MNIRFTDKGALEIDLHTLLEYVRKEDTASLAESLSCDDDIIRHVVHQIVHGITENGYSGAHNLGAPACEDLDRCSPLDWARRRVAKMSGEIAKAEIEDLEYRLKREIEKSQALDEKIWGLNTSVENLQSLLRDTIDEKKTLQEDRNFWRTRAAALDAQILNQGTTTS